MRCRTEITISIRTKPQSKIRSAKHCQAFHHAGVYPCQTESTEASKTAFCECLDQEKRAGGRGGAGTAVPLSNQQAEVSALAPGGSELRDAERIALIDVPPH